MTLPELAALAAERVPGFRRPTRKCEWCGGVKWGNRLEPCDKCDDNGRVLDDSPAALLMAVAVYCSERALTLEIDEYHVLVSAYARSATADLDSASPRTIARAALVALLRAHGVEVAE